MEHQHPILSIRIAGKGINNCSNNDRLCSRIGLTESSNMLHYSNVSSREKEQAISGDQGACLEAQPRRRGRQHRSRTGLRRRRSRCLAREEGEETINIKANICMTMHDMTMNGARCALTRQQVIPVKGGNIRENIPGVSRFWTDEPEGESCVFAMLGMCGGRTGCVSGFVSSF